MTALIALGHIRTPSGRCRARYADIPKEQRPPGPSSGPTWCGLRVGHEGPHRCSHGNAHVSFVMRADLTIEGPPLADLCSKCGVAWPCRDAAAVIAAFAP